MIIFLYKGKQEIHCFLGITQYGNIYFDIFMNFRRINLSAERMCVPQLPEEVFMEGMYEVLRLDEFGGLIPISERKSR